MPSSSKKQHNLMEAVAHSPAFAKKVGIAQSVGKDFAEADKGRKFGMGGRTDLQKVNKPKTDHGKMALFKKGGTMGLFKGKEDASEEKAEARALRSGKISKSQYVAGEKSEGKKEPMSEIKKNAAAIKSGKMSPSAYAKEEASEYKKGGAVFRSAANGIAQRGKTKGTQIKMCGGGMAKGKK